MCARPATESRRSSRTSPMHEPSPRDTRTSPATAEVASSPILTIVSAIDLDAQALEHLVPAALVRDRQERPGPLLALDDEVGVQQQARVAGAGAFGQHGL